MSQAMAASSGSAALRERAAGWTLALYLVVGTWSVARVTGMEPTLLAQPRAWAVLVLVLLSASPGSGRGRDQPASRKPGVLAAELAWLGFTLLALTWAPDFELAQVDAGELSLLITVTLCVHRLGRGGRADALLTGLRHGLTAVLIGLATVALLAGIGAGRLAVLGGGPNVFGRNMGLLCVLALERALRSGPAASGSAATIWPAIATVAAGLVALSGSRGAMISTSVGVGVLLTLGRGQIARRIVLVAIVGALGVAGSMLTPIGARVIETFSERMLQMLIVDGYVSGRDQVYAVALERGVERPIVGHGLASFAAHTRWPYAHNIVLDAWFETGAIGVALLGLYLGRLGRSIARLGSQGRELWIALGMLVFTAVQFSGGRYDARLLMVFGSLCLVASPGRSR